MYFPTNWGAKEPQNPQNHRVVMTNSFFLIQGYVELWIRLDNNCHGKPNLPLGPPRKLVGAAKGY